MSNVINKSTLQYLTSVHTPDYSDGNWLIDPDLSKVKDIPKKYWKIENCLVCEMTEIEKKAVDDYLIEQDKIAQAEQIIQEKTRELAIEKGVTDGVLNADGTLKE